MLIIYFHSFHSFWLLKEMKYILYGIVSLYPLGIPNHNNNFVTLILFASLFVTAVLLMTNPNVFAFIFLHHEF
jgi:hypothetical protein